MTAGAVDDRGGDRQLVHHVRRCLEHLTPRAHRLTVLTGVLPGRRSVAQHEAIIARAAAGDAAGTASATRENWLASGARVEQALAGQ